MNLPMDGCDSHIHIYEKEFINNENKYFKEYPLSDYLKVQKELNLSKIVFVQPKIYKTDNACLVSTINRTANKSVGIAVVNTEVTDTELEKLNSFRIRGIRFSVWNPKEKITTIDMINPLASRINEYGWHIQVHMTSRQLVDNESLLKNIPCPLVIDHMGRIPKFDHPDMKILERLLDSGKAWVKVSAPYLIDESNSSHFSNAKSIAKHLIMNYQDRIVWGSDWPHVTESNKPTTVQLLDWIESLDLSDSLIDKIFVTNPRDLYQFNKE